MPEMLARVPYQLDTLRRALNEHKTKFREAFAQRFEWQLHEVSWLVQHRTPHEVSESENVAELDLRIDMGNKPGATDDNAREFMNELVRICPVLRTYEVAVWLISHNTNGFAKRRGQGEYGL